MREVVAQANSFSQVLRLIGLRPAGGNHATIRRHVEEVWRIPTDHFCPAATRAAALRREPLPLEQALVRDSTYHRANLKQRLYESGLKPRACELCGQGEDWRGKRIALILDHINGDAIDNRLENLRIVCPNCNAALETHCGRNKPRGRPPRQCGQCGGTFRAIHAEQRFCSQHCAARHNTPALRRVERPPTDVLLALVERDGYVATGRRFGVSDNAIRKWLRWESVDPPKGKVPYPPVRRALSDERAAVALGLLAKGLSDREVADRVSVAAHSIKALRLGRSYRHVPRPPGLPLAA